MNKKSRGFTFIELVIAVTIFAVIAASVYSVFRVGVQLWQRTTPIIRTNESFRFFFNTITKDLRNSVAYAKKGKNFEGSRDRMSFMALVEISGGSAPSRIELARVVYYFDRNSGSVKRAVATRLEGLNADLAKAEEALGGLESSSFGIEYCYKLSSSRTEYDYEWKDEWEEKDADSGKIPRGVRVKAKDYSKTIFIPTGKLGGADAT